LKYFTIAIAKSIAVPMPRLVMMLPSVTAVSSETTAPVNFSSKPGWQTAHLPFNIPAAPSTEGAAQIAATSFP